MFDRNHTQWRSRRGQSRLGSSAALPRFLAPALLAAVCGLLLFAGAVFFIPARPTDATAAQARQASNRQDSADRDAPLNLVGQPAAASAPIRDDAEDATQAADPTEGTSGAVACNNASGKIITADQQTSGMTAVASTQSPLRIGSTVQVTPSDGDIPAGGTPVTLTITGKALLPTGICLDMSSQAWQTFDPQDAAYRHATITVADGQ
jgi:hypothetical protein